MQHLLARTGIKSRPVLYEETIMNDKRNWCVYVHISPSNKYYVGITSQKPEQRWSNGNGYKSCPAFHNAIVKYGWNNFYHEIIAEHLSESEAKRFEIVLIDKLKSSNKNFGYNITLGGSGTVGVCHYGMNNPFFGRKHSKSSKVAIGLSTENRWQNGKYRDICKPVHQFDIHGNYIASYDNMQNAERATGISHSWISKVCRKELYSTHGYIWVYQSECTDFDIAHQRYHLELNYQKSLYGKHMQKPVNLYDLTGIFIAQFESATDLAKELGVHKDTVSSACRHNSTLQKQYKCSYA